MSNQFITLKVHQHNLQLQIEYLAAKRADIIEANVRSRERKVRGFQGLSDQVLVAVGNTPLYELDKSELGLRIANARNRTATRHGEELSRERMRKIYEVARQMLELGRDAYPQLYKTVSIRELKGFRIPRKGVGRPAPEAQPCYEWEDVLKVAQLEVADDDLWLRRAQAAFCLQAASAARAHALVTLPLKAIDLDGLWVRQDPNLGVWTKNDVRATTCLMDMPELLTPVRNWHSFLLQRVGPNALFFNPFNRDDGGLVPTQKLAGDNRVNALIDDYQALCPIAGIPYRGTHGLRRFHIGFILMRCKDVDDFQALSHNVMHKRLSTTELYIKPKQDKLAARYRQFASSAPVTNSPQQAVAMAEQLAADDPKIAQMIRAAMKEVLAEYMGSKGD